MDKAKEMKVEKLKLEEHLFNREKKWTPHLTNPVEPRLSAFLSKNDREVTVKSLNKPVDILGKTQEIMKAKKGESAEVPVYGLKKT